MSNLSVRPAADEYAPYYGGYINQVPDGDIIEILSRQLDETRALLASIAEERGDFRYAADKWSIKELLGHLIDAERVFAYRALRFGRGDQTELAGFDQDPYVLNFNVAKRSLAELADEFAVVRQATLYLVKNFDEAAWSQRGVASQNEVSVRALVFIMAGHVNHHLRILRERYL